MPKFAFTSNTQRQADQSLISFFIFEINRVFFLSPVTVRMHMYIHVDLDVHYLNTFLFVDFLILVYFP